MAKKKDAVIEKKYNEVQFIDGALATMISLAYDGKEFTGSVHYALLDEDDDIFSGEAVGFDIEPFKISKGDTNTVIPQIVERILPFIPAPTKSGRPYNCSRQLVWELMDKSFFLLYDFVEMLSDKEKRSEDNKEDFIRLVQSLTLDVSSEDTDVLDDVTITPVSPRGLLLSHDEGFVHFGADDETESDETVHLLSFIAGMVAEAIMACK